MISSAMSPTLGLQIGLLAYHQFTTWCDLYPFNGSRFYTRSEKFAEATMNGVLMSLPVVGFGVGIAGLKTFGFFYYFILFAVELATWWAPYLIGPTPKWRDTFARVFSNTWHVLPGPKLRPRPNVEHLILMALTATTAWFTASTYTAENAEPYRRLWIAAIFAVVVVSGTLFQFVGRAKK